MKILGALFSAALKRKTLQAYEMVFIDIDEGIRLTNAPRDIEYLGETYTSVGAFLGFSEITEEQEFGVSEITVSLAGFPMYDLVDEFGEPVNLFSQFLEHEYVDRTIRIYRAFFQEDALIVDSGTPAIMLMFDGLVDSPVIQDDPADNTTIAVKAVNQWVDFERTNGRRTNDAEQQVLFPGDRIFKFAKDNVKDIQWKTDS